MLLNTLKYLFAGAFILVAAVAGFVGFIYFIFWLFEGESETARKIVLTIILVILSYFIGFWAFHPYYLEIK